VIEPNRRVHPMILSQRMPGVGREFFPGFELSVVDTGEAKLRVRHGGSGPALLLLLGHPQTHLMWHAVAPGLADRFTVVAPDLRGYGESSKPETTPDHEPYSKRAMARDQIELMRRLGFERFSVCGHDRGARCAYRLALDHRESVVKLAVLDIVPTGDALAAVYYRYAGSNPVRALPPAQRPRPERKEAAYFENEELPRLFAHLHDEPYRTLCLVALKTGMRQGELVALRWCDVDLEQAVVRVRRSYTGGTLGTPKNRDRRDVDLISDVVELLAGWRDSWGSLNGDESLVFHGSDGLGFLTPAVLLRRHLYPAMASADIRRVGPTQERRTFHSFRHTFAKRALESGAQITWLSRHLGHSSLKVTTDIYGHWERAERKLQAAKMEGAFPV
jgi:integrase